MMPSLAYPSHLHPLTGKTNLHLEAPENQDRNLQRSQPRSSPLGSTPGPQTTIRQNGKILHQFQQKRSQKNGEVNLTIRKYRIMNQKAGQWVFCFCKVSSYIGVQSHRGPYPSVWFHPKIALFPTIHFF